MSVLELHIGGMAGLAVGLLAIAAAAGFTGQTILEAICTIFGIVAVTVYIGMALDRYSRAAQYG